MLDLNNFATNLRNDLKILLVDNYDSFTYNLVHYLEGFDCEVKVERNDEINFKNVDSFDKIVLSPGPGLPSEALGMMKIIEIYADKKPILGVCLGFQALVEFFGGKIFNQNEIIHGHAVDCNFTPSSLLFKSLPSNFKVGLYHSWAAEKSSFPPILNITGESENGVLMAFEHSSLPIAGVQFHPESILTENGKEIIENFLTNFN